MERLTGIAPTETNGIYKGKNAHVEKGTAYLKNTAFTINDLSGNATMLVQKAINLLARFEDIGQTPEELADVAAREDNVQEALERMEEALENAEKTWISVNEKLPEPEKRVLVCAEVRCQNGDIYKHITAGMYEDGTIWREDSSWVFNDFDNIGVYDEEHDDWKIPEGWWEYTIYNDCEGNYPIDDFVTHWMPLPELPKEVDE